MWIEIPRPENLTNNFARHTEALDSCFDLIRSHQQRIQRSPSPEIEPATAQPKLCHWDNSPHRTQVVPKLLLMVIARPINLNVSGKLHPYSLQRTRLPPGPRLPRRIENMHSSNWYNPRGKDIDVHFSFLSRGIIFWIEIPQPAVQCFRMSCASVHGVFWSL